MAKYKVGDLVRSKAGGPKLVVDAVLEFDGFLAGGADQTSYFCIWWVGNKRSREEFSEGVLDPWADGA